MKKKSLYGLIMILASVTVLSGCSGDFARRADGTCVFLCGGGGAAGGGTAGG